jgi:hypothetical protein
MVDYTHSWEFGVSGPDSGPIVARPAAATGTRHKSQALDFSRAQIAALFVLFAGIVSIPILLYPLPPLSDYINHLSRMHVIAAIGGDGDLARFYEINWQVIPNLMMDMVLPVMVRIMSIYTAGQVYTIASFVLITTGAFALNRELHGRWSVLPLAAFPLLYNFVFLVGTMNYVFGIGLSLWALVAWIALRERHFALRLGVSTLFVFGLFFCHLYAVGIYAVGLLAYELHRLWGASRNRRGGEPALARLILDFVGTGAPFLLVLPLLMMSPTWGLRGAISWEWAGKLDGLIFAIDVYSDAVAIALTATVAAIAGFAIWQRALKFHPFGYVLIAVGAIIYLAMPRVIFDTYMADQRLPISLVFMAVACAQLDLGRLAVRFPLVRHGFLAVLVLLLGMRVLEVQTTWAELSPVTASFRESVDLIDRGSKVLVAYADPDGGDDVRNLGLVHAACIAVIERSALVTTIFSVVGKQILHVRADYRGRVDTQDGTPPMVNSLAPAAAQFASFAEPVSIKEAGPVSDQGSVSSQETVSDAEAGPPQKASDYWVRWPSDYDYLYVLFTTPEHENPDPQRLTEMFRGDRFVLYRIEHSLIADAGRAAK